MVIPPDDLAVWVKRSRSAQELPETVSDTATVCALAHLIEVARQTEQARQAERARGRKQQPTQPAPDTTL